LTTILFKSLREYLRDFADSDFDSLGNHAIIFVKVECMSDQNARIRIVFHSGYKGEETPRAIVIAGREYPVDKVIWRKRSQDKDTRESFELFRCRVAGQEVTLKVGPSGECELLGGHRLLPPS
jgi:hypothetical protein